MKALLKILASKFLTVALLAALFAACSAGTLLPLPVALARVYHSAWFFALLAAFSLQTLACMANELLRRKVPFGFLLLHVGSLLILAGGLWGFLRGEKGRVAVPEKASVSYFYPDWKGCDLLERGDGTVLRGRFAGIEKGNALFLPRDGKPEWVPLADVKDLRLDPDRPGRKLESDIVDLPGNETIHGFVLSAGPAGVRMKTEQEEREIPADRIVLLEMGDPAVRPLGFALRLDGFRIDYYEEAALWKLTLSRPGSEEPFVLRAEAGAEADLGQGFRAKVLRFFPDAVVNRETKALEARSDQPLNPAVELEISWAGGREVRPVFERGMPGFHRAAGASNVSANLVAPVKAPVKAYVSEVSILEEGMVTRQASIEVNSPLTHEGYAFYQVDYDERDGRYRSVFEVVRDPGLPLTVAGFAMLLLGAFLTCWGKPLLARLRKNRDGAGPAESQPGGLSRGQEPGGVL